MALAKCARVPANQTFQSALHGTEADRASCHWQKTGRFRAGTVVMLAIDSHGNILKAAKMQGVTVFSRVRSLKGLEGKPLPKLEEEDLAGFDKLTKGAIRDAISSYKIISNGGELKLKKTWLERLIPAKK